VTSSSILAVSMVTFLILLFSFLKSMRLLKVVYWIFIFLIITSCVDLMTVKFAVEGGFMAFTLLFCTI